MVRHSPRASLGSKHLPWAPARVRQVIIAQPEYADSVRDLVCAKDAGASTSLGVGTSVIARIVNAGGWYGGGRRFVGKSNVAAMPRLEPVMPKPRKIAVSR
jgi:hypothetical protein